MWILTGCDFLKLKIFSNNLKKLKTNQQVYNNSELLLIWLGEIKILWGYVKKENPHLLEVNTEAFTDKILCY